MNKHEFLQRLGTWRDSLRSTDRLPPPRLWPDLLQYRDDTEVALAVVALDGQALAVLSERLRDDGECVRLAVQENACAFEHASHRLKGDKTFVHTLLHIPKSGWVYEYITDELKKDQELAQLAVSGNGWMIEFVPEPHRRDWQLIRLAVANEYHALSSVEPALRVDKAFMHEMVRINGRCLEHASTDLQEDAALALAAVTQDPKAFRFAGPNLKNTVGQRPPVEALHEILTHKLSDEPPAN